MQRVSGYSEQGGKSVVIGGLAGSQKVQGSYPFATVTVYLSGTLTLATIYSDNSSTALANPFTSDVNGFWFWYAANGRYDVRFSGGGIPAPFTIGDIMLADPSSGPAFSGYPVSVNQGGTGVTTLTGILEGHGTSAITGNVAASQLQYLRRKPNVVVTAYEFSALPYLVASDYDFPLQAPAENISPALKQVTMIPVPLGVNGLDASHFLGIYNNAGVFQEAVLINGGSASSGAASGTVTFSTIAGTYAAGSYKIGSATGGVQEAVQISPLGSTQSVTRIVFPSAVSTYAPITISAKNIIFQGNGNLSHSVNRQPAFLVGHTFNVLDAAGVTFDGMGIQAISNLPHYASIFAQSSNLKILNSQIYHGYYGVLIDFCALTSNTVIDGLTYANLLDDARPVAGVKMFTSAVQAGNLTIINSHIGGYGSVSDGTDILHPTVGIWLVDTDGARIFDSMAGGNLGGVLVELNSGYYISNIWIDNLVVDAFFAYGVAFTSTGTDPLGNVRITNSHFVAYAGSDGTANGIDFGVTYGIGASIDNVQIIGNHFSGIGRSAITFAAASLGGKSIIISNNLMIDNGVTLGGGYPSILLATGATGLHITGNVIGDKQSIGASTYGIYAAGTLADSVIVGNDLTDNVTGPLAIGGAITNTVIDDNLGIDNVTGSVASGASIALPFNPTINVTGTTGVGTVTGLLEGRRGTIITTDGVVVFTAGATIGNSKTTTQNVPVSFTVTGGKIYLS